ncbi:neprilysin-1, partial [Nephila pilipes]
AIVSSVSEEEESSSDSESMGQSSTSIQIEAIGDKPLRDVVRELGGWPVSERDWEEPEWPLEHLLGQLRGDYNQGIIIEQWVGPDDKNSSVNVIQHSSGAANRDTSLCVQSFSRKSSSRKLYTDQELQKFLP